MSKSSHDKMLQKGVFTGKLEQDENGNYFCGEYLLDYKIASTNHVLVIGSLLNQ